MLRRHLVPSLVLLGLAGCKIRIEQRIGTTELAPGVRVTLVAEGTGTPIPGATLRLSEDRWAEAMLEVGAGVYAGAIERPGTYTLAAGAPGFDSRTVEDIVVPAGDGHVVTQDLTVELRMAPVGTAGVVLRWAGGGEVVVVGWVWRSVEGDG